MEVICKLFGRVRQAWYAATRRQEKVGFQTDAILQEVRRIRRDIPGMGTHKLHHEMQVFLTRHRIKLGRDRLHALLKENGMLAKRKAQKVTTTQSNHTHFKYPNKVKNVIPSRANELWVSDLTYISVGPTYAYLYIIMDAFSRKIVGWSFEKTMHAQGALRSLNMALLARKDISQSLIHHSDRGVQYCSWAYVQRLRQVNATISMTESGDPNENSMAERVLQSLKEDCKLSRTFTSFAAATEGIERAIMAYNTVRPHASLNYLTPHQMHQRKRKVKLRWYPYKKVRYGNVQYEGLLR
ncbi:IS3 family transposase [Spirosoma linguale]|uniref:Integrase catalytic region n=1 Tax=Spirosoma linguale (strain ATCC 33905 / DSM 74 / LMG 10896 / Claus 1) TaxID=504472 RepID=D2QC82_SPILD|nr:Integrase catalytic region [Spirosoma linguale DSM 74]ADB39613.1 Integrase catalytic region [Spirosoma linguale DSM 74]